MRKILIAATLALCGAFSAAAQDQSVQTINGASAPAPPQAGVQPYSEQTKAHYGKGGAPAAGSICRFTNGPLAGKQISLPKPMPVGSDCNDGSGNTGKVALR